MLLVLGSIFGNGYTRSLSSMLICFSVDRFYDKNQVPKQLLRLKGSHILDDVSFHAVS